MGRPRLARLLAPLALVVCAAAVLVVVQNGLKESTGDAATTRTTPVTTTKATSKVKRYRVRSGDTLGGISAKVDVPVDRIQTLNPKVDPQSLRAGQLLRVRR